MPSISHYTVISAYFATVSSRFRKMRTQSTARRPPGLRCRNAAADTQTDDIAIFVSIVKSCYYIRMGCGRISLAGFPREAPTIRPMAVYFCGRLPALFPIAYMRYRRGRPKAFLTARYRPSGGARPFPVRTDAAGGPYAYGRWPRIFDDFLTAGRCDKKKRLIIQTLKI